MAWLLWATCYLFKIGRVFAGSSDTGVILASPLQSISTGYSSVDAILFLNGTLYSVSSTGSNIAAQQWSKSTASTGAGSIGLMSGSLTWSSTIPSSAIIECKSSILISSASKIWQLSPVNIGVSPNPFDLPDIKGMSGVITTLTCSTFPPFLIVGFNSGAVNQYLQTSTGKFDLPNDDSKAINLYQHTSSVVSLTSAVINGSYYIFSGSRDSTIIRYNILTKEIILFSGHAASINSLNFFLDPELGPVLYSASSDGTIKQWNALTGTAFRTFQIPDAFQCFAVVANRNFVYGGAGNSNIYRWDRTTGLSNVTYVGHNSSITALALNESYIYTAAKDGNLIKWDAFANTTSNSTAGTSAAVNISVSNPSPANVTTPPQNITTTNVTLSDSQNATNQAQLNGAVPGSTNLTNVTASNQLYIEQSYWSSINKTLAFAQCIGYCSSNPCSNACRLSFHNITAMINGIFPCYQQCDSLGCIFVFWLNETSCRVIHSLVDVPRGNSNVAFAANSSPGSLSPTSAADSQPTLAVSGSLNAISSAGNSLSSNANSNAVGISSNINSAVGLKMASESLSKSPSTDTSISSGTSENTNSFSIVFIAGGCGLVAGVGAAFIRSGGSKRNRLQDHEYTRLDAHKMA